MQETLVHSLGWEDTLEKGKAKKKKMLENTQYSGPENSMDYIVIGKESDMTEKLSLSLYLYLYKET